MGAYVVTPNGETLHYSRAGYADRSFNGFTRLLTEKDGGWVADVPHSWAVGWTRPTPVGLDHVAEELRAQIRQAPGATLASIKRALRSFDSRTCRWKV